jgi:hypothetical protein
VFWFVSIKWHGVTGGEDGLLNIKRLPVELGFTSISLKSNEALFYFCVAAVRAGSRRALALVHSPLGRVLSAIKQNEMRATFVGYNVWLYKWLGLHHLAGVAGLAGAMFAMAQQSAYPNVMSLHSSGFVVMMVLIGGGWSASGAGDRRAVLHPRARPARRATETWLLWYGLLFVAMVLCKPEGIAGLWQACAPQRAAAAAPALPHEGGRAWPCLKRRPAQALRRPGRAAGHHLAFEEGRLSGIMGPNGAGKTTCFNVLTGRYAPDRGRVRFAGEDITGLPPRASRARASRARSRS